jgi:predicted regulator of Ras-like GTPase activity (Roadblock/LC7/MglB family)
MSNGVKTRFAGLLRELLRRFDENETGAGTSQSPRPVAHAAPPPHPAPISQFATPRPKPVATPAPPPTENITEVELPLPSVLENLPPQLRSRLTLTGVDLSRASISISIGKIMPQLALGIVKITFGELRQAAPSLFNIDEEYDSLPVVLPLSEVLARLNSNSLIRNPAQKSIAVPADITGPFSGRGEGITISKAPLKPSPVATPPMRMTTPASSTPVKTSLPPVAPPPPLFVSRSIKPEPHVPPPSRNGNGNRVPVQPMIPTIPIQPTAPVTPKPMSFTPEQATILAPLAALSENWPEALRMEIAQLTLTNAQVALPVNLIEPSLKRGRVTFTWRNLRSWIKPAPPAVSVHDGLELELPLKVVAPLFLARQGGAAKTARSHQPASPPAEIPNLFFGFPQPQPPHEIPEPPAKAPVPDETRFAPKPAEAPRADTNYYIWVESDTTRVAARPPETELKREPLPATDFSSRYATPKEVISRAMALNGVAGAFVALPDGLMVASQIPSDLNADTLAAFLPQIYGRVNQCTKELRMGQLNNLNFTVGNVPWKIFRVNGVYFAAFGRAGEQLPTAQLAQLAGELDRKTQ